MVPRFSMRDTWTHEEAPVRQGDLDSFPALDAEQMGQDLVTGLGWDFVPEQFSLRGESAVGHGWKIDPIREAAGVNQIR